jgi:hypothetical protein
METGAGITRKLVFKGSYVFIGFGIEGREARIYGTNLAPNLIFSRRRMEYPQSS